MSKLTAKNRQFSMECFVVNTTVVRNRRIQMVPDFRNLNIMLTACLTGLLLPWILILSGVIPVTESNSMSTYMTTILFGLSYYVVLGVLASRKNRSVIKWVGLSIIFSPIAFIVSYPLILLARPLPMNEYDAFKSQLTQSR